MNTIDRFFGLDLELISHYAVESSRTTHGAVERLEAALWCFWRTSTFEAAILEAANLGDDADTTAAICGQVAGAYYGEQAVPSRWVARRSRN